jgi:hypothetical protein
MQEVDAAVDFGEKALGSAGESDEGRNDRP